MYVKPKRQTTNEKRLNDVFVQHTEGIQSFTKNKMYCIPVPEVAIHLDDGQTRQTTMAWYEIAE